MKYSGCILKWLSKTPLFNKQITNNSYLFAAGFGRTSNSIYNPAIKFYHNESCTPVDMSFTTFDSNKSSAHKSMIIMHGLLGSRTNWKSLGKAINKKTGITVYTVDARNHGESPHAPQLDYISLGKDVLLFQENHNLQDAILMGHSMGGRAVMAAALLKPEVTKEIIVLDISPLGVSEAISSLPRFVNIMQRVQVPANYNMSQARKYIDNILMPYVPELGIRQFLLTNLMQENGAFKWRVNLESIEKNFNPHISTFPLVSSENEYEGKTTFIGGEKSNYIRKCEHEGIRELFPNAQFHTLPGAGHWLHADKPQEFLALLNSILLK